MRADLCEIADTTQQAIGDARRSARTFGNLLRTTVVDAYTEHVCRMPHDGFEIVDAVEIKTVHDAKTLAQRRRQHARPCGRTDKREVLEVDLDGLGVRAFIDHEID